MTSKIGTVKIPDTYSELYPGRFLKADLLRDKPRTLTISKVHVEVMPDDKTGGEKDRGIISFKETTRQLALNRTNGECLKAMFGKKVKEWCGKRVTLVPEQAKFGAEDVDAIRISGSPDFDRTVTIEIKMPKRKPVKRTLRNTSGNSNSVIEEPVETAPVAETTTEADAAEIALSAASEEE